MTTGRPTRWSWLLRLELFSPRGFLLRALGLAAAYALCELAGLREYTTFLSGTAAGGRWETSVVWGITYIFVYLGIVLVAPILVIGAALLHGWQRLVRHRQGPPP
jgi:hypothetical protein